MKNTKDGTGKDVVIGKKYGWSRNSNGTTTASIGVLKKITPSGRGSMKPTSVRKALWDEEAKEQRPGNNATVKLINLFPLE